MCVGVLYTLTCRRPRTLVVVVSKKESLNIIFLNLLGELYVRVNGIQMIMKLLHVIFLKARMAVVHVSVPPSWRMSSCGDCSFFYVFHRQVSDSGTHERSHGTAERLLFIGIVGAPS